MTGTRLGKELGIAQYFTIGFGAIIGTGWLTVMGIWLGKAGPGGAILAFIAGAVIMGLVALCYAEVSTMFPVSGAELAYAYEVFGTKGAFLVGWILALVYISTTAFEAISASWVVGVLIPGSGGPVLYHGFQGEPVTLSTVLIGVGGTAFLGVLNYRGARSAARFQDIATYALLLFGAAFMIAGLAKGSTENLIPLFQQTATGTDWAGVTAIFVMTPFFYAGFNLVPQAMEEMAHGASLRKTGTVMLVALGVAIAFYCFAILASAMTMPWKELIKFDLPVAAAFEKALGSLLLSKVVLLAALFGIVTTWNPVYLGASRVLFALGRARIAAPWLGKVHPVFQSPGSAVLFTGIAASAAILLGRKAILPIVSIAGLGFAIAFLSTALVALRLRRTRPDFPRPYRMPGGRTTALLAVIGSIFVLFLALYQPWIDSKGAFPLEWSVLLSWTALGAVFWVLARKVRSQADETERRRLILGDPVSSPARDASVRSV